MVCIFLLNFYNIDDNQYYSRYLNIIFIIIKFTGKPFTITYATGSIKGFLGQDTVRVSARSRNRILWPGRGLERGKMDEKKIDFSYCSSALTTAHSPCPSARSDRLGSVDIIFIGKANTR